MKKLLIMVFAFLFPVVAFGADIPGLKKGENWTTLPANPPQKVMSVEDAKKLAPETTGKPDKAKKEEKKARKKAQSDKVKERKAGDPEKEARRQAIRDRHEQKKEELRRTPRQTGPTSHDDEL